MVGRLETPGDGEVTTEGPACERRGMRVYKDLCSVAILLRPRLSCTIYLVFVFH